MHLDSEPQFEDLQNIAIYSVKLGSWESREHFLFWWRGDTWCSFNRSITPMWSWWMGVHDGRKPLERRWVLVDGTEVCFFCGVHMNPGRWICGKLLKDMYLSKRKRLWWGMGWGLMRNVCVCVKWQLKCGLFSSAHLGIALLIWAAYHHFWCECVCLLIGSTSGIDCSDEGQTESQFL